MMTDNKHTVSTDALETLGSQIDKFQGRDAIHLAVNPTEAAQTLLPGGHVKLDADGRAVRADIGKGLGIVDPFLTDAVKAGDWFWLVVYPRQITSLHHVWEHPDFPAADNSATQSEKWLREFVQGVAGDSMFDEVIDRALTTPGAMSFGDDISGEIPPEFWSHVERFTGRKVPETPNRSEWFSCAC